MSKLLAIGLASGIAVSTAAIPAHSATIIGLGDAASIIVALIDAGFADPQVLLTDEPTHLDLSITGGPVTGLIAKTLKTNLKFRYWEGNITLTQNGELFSEDRITASISMKHIARPHGEVGDGGIFTFPTTTLKAGDPDVPLSAIEPHPPHSDIYSGSFHAGRDGGDITGWNLRLDGLHTVPEPATWAMLVMGFGIVGATVRLRRRRLQIAPIAV